MRARRLGNRRIGRERDGFRQRRSPKWQLDLQPLRRHEDDVVLTASSEAVVTCGDHVAPWWQRRESEAAAGIRVRVSIDAGIDVGDRDRHVLDGFAGHRGDASPDFRRAALRERRRATEERDNDGERVRRATQAIPPGT
jgi:hypothetical protein